MIRGGRQTGQGKKRETNWTRQEKGHILERTRKGRHTGQDKKKKRETDWKGHKEIEIGDLRKN